IQRDKRGTGLSHGSAQWVGCYLNVASQEGLSRKWVSFIFIVQRDKRGTGLSHGSAQWVGCYFNVASQEGLSSKWVSYIFDSAARSASTLTTKW
ncbi:hypothetical protein, partial [Halomonas alkalicola]|uniref:hypothetical protein n=1 Tax=Halomonas alkalicola TaxID=1930622 RepID=UPI0035E93FE0